VKSFLVCLSVGLTFAISSIAQCAHAAPVDNLCNKLTETGETLEQDEAQYKFCNWLAETNRRDAMRRGLEDEAVQLSYEDTFDYCYELPFSALGVGVLP
jgi:hypothetical protein